MDASRRSVLAALSAGLGGCSAMFPRQASPPSDGDWPMQGANPAGDYHQSDTDAPTEGVHERWQRELQSLGGWYAEPVYYDGALYVLSDGIEVRDGTTGRRRRTVDIRLLGPPAVTTRTPYRNATLVGLTGTTSLTSPLLKPGGGSPLSVPTEGIIALNPTDGLGSDPRPRQRWRFPHSGGRFSVWSDDGQIGAVPTGDRLVFGGSWHRSDGSDAGGLLALDAATGKIAWAYRLSTDSNWTGSAGRPSVLDGVAYALSVSGTCHAVAVIDGNRRWQRDFDAETYAARPLVATPESVVTVVDDVVYGLDHADGTTLWKRDFPGSYSDESEALTAADGYVLVRRATEEQRLLLALDTATGDTLWQVEDVTIRGQPVVADGTVFTMERDVLTARALTDGTIRWRFEPDTSPVDVAPIVADGTVYLQTLGHLYALEAPA